MMKLSKIRRKPLFIASAALIIGIFLLSAGCGDDDNVTNSILESHLMVMHAGPENYTFDVVIDSVEMIVDMLQLETSDYMAISGGTHNLIITDDWSAGTVPEILTDINLEIDMLHSLFLISTNDDADFLLVEDMFALPDSANITTVRYVNLSPNLGPSDILVAAYPTDTALGNDFTHVDYKEITEYHKIEAEFYTFKIRNRVTSEILLTSPSMELVNGRVYTLCAVGYVGGVGEEALSLEVAVNF